MAKIHYMQHLKFKLKRVECEINQRACATHLMVCQNNNIVLTNSLFIIQVYITVWLDGMS